MGQPGQKLVANTVHSTAQHQPIFFTRLTNEMLGKARPWFSSHDSTFPTAADLAVSFLILSSWCVTLALILAYSLDNSPEIAVLFLRSARGRWLTFPVTVVSVELSLVVTPVIVLLILLVTVDLICERDAMLDTLEVTLERASATATAQGKAGQPKVVLQKEFE